MKSLLALLVTVFVTVFLASSVQADVIAHAAMVRDWKNPATTLGATLGFDVPGASAPATSPTSDWTPGALKIKVTVVLEGPADMRPGEVEKFTLEGKYLEIPKADVPAGSTTVRVRLVPAGVAHAYQDLESSNSFEREVQVWGTSGTYDLGFRLTSRGRLVIVPPNTISEVLLDGPPSGDSLKMTWKDGGNPGLLATVYKYQIYEKRWWWTDLLVAEGELTADSSTISSVEFVRGSSTLADPGRFFTPDKSYGLYMSLMRKNPEYKPLFSAPVKMGFRYRQVPGGFAERIVTPFGATLGGSRPGRDLDRVGAFDRLLGSSPR